MERGGCVYILASSYKRLYTGVTSDLFSRMGQLKANANPGSFTARYNGSFMARYNIDQLVYYESLESINQAIARESHLKNLHRIDNVKLIAGHNPTWRDLSEKWGTPPDRFNSADQRTPTAFSTNDPSPRSSFRTKPGISVLRTGRPSAANLMRIALFGGSFDPPHRGHLAIARAAAEAFTLNRILFTPPAGRQPLKQAHAAPYAARLRMTELACEDANRANQHRPATLPARSSGRSDAREDPGGSMVFEPSTLDAPHSDASPNYTVDTLERLHTRLPPGRDLRHWPAPTPSTISTSGTRPAASSNSRNGSSSAAPASPSPSPSPLPASPPTVHLLEGVHEEVSATVLRERLAQGDPCTDLPQPLGRRIHPAKPPLPTVIRVPVAP